MVRGSFNGVFDGARVLVTGHTGFKGAWLSLWLKQLGAAIHGYGLQPPTKPSFHQILESNCWNSQTFSDIRDRSTLIRSLESIQPDVIFHLAAQPLVRLSYSAPVETFEVNVLGTIQLLEAVRALKLRCPVVVVTSDKCYQNHNWDYGYREDDALGGHDVYSMSKAATELVVQSWRDSFFKVSPELGPVATARAGNVIGGGDYAPDRLVPDCIRALIEGRDIHIRNPKATRPWQHVLDCLSGYLLLASNLVGTNSQSSLATAFNFGPSARSNRSVAEVVDALLRLWPGRWIDDSKPGQVHEAHKLHLSTDRAAQQLGWHSTWDFNQSINATASWYRERHAAKSEMVGYSIGELERFTQDALKTQQLWAKGPS